MPKHKWCQGRRWWSLGSILTAGANWRAGRRWSPPLTTPNPNSNPYWQALVAAVDHVAGKCELEVVESRFEKNRETNVPGLSGNGGAIFLFVPAQATIRRSEFVGNEAQGDGGALSVCPTALKSLCFSTKNDRRKIIPYLSGKNAR